MAIDCDAGGIDLDEPARQAREQQFNELLAGNAAALRRLASSYARPDDHDDLLQEIAMSLWRALPKFRGDCSARTYLYRIAHNCCITHISRRRAMLSIDDLEIEPKDPNAATEATVSAEQQRSRLLRAVRRLPVTYREVVVLMLEGLDYKEIAEVVGISQNNVGVRLNRARQQLKALIEEES